MSDLVMRVREMAQEPVIIRWNYRATLVEAADRIEALEAELLTWIDHSAKQRERIEELQKALREIVEDHPLSHSGKIALAALNMGIIGEKHERRG